MKNIPKNIINYLNYNKALLITIKCKNLEFIKTYMKILISVPRTQIIFKKLTKTQFSKIFKLWMKIYLIITKMSIFLKIVY